MDANDKSQRPENADESANKPVARYVMPGLCPKIVRTFRRKKGVIPTPRTIAQNADVELGVVVPALLHDLYEQVGELRGMVARRPVQSETVREFRVVQQARRA